MKPSTIRENVLLAPYTTFKIGGPARYFVETKSEDELAEALQWAAEEKLPIFTLGGGSNLLISDDGFNGLVIRDVNMTITVDGLTVTSAAGVPLPLFVATCTQHGLSGAEELVGIPGTVGGAVRGNAGAWGRSVADILVSVKVFDGRVVRELSNNDCQFEYRGSLMKKEKWIVIAAVFELVAAGQTAIADKANGYLIQRTAKHPTEPSAGSVFKNLVVADLDAVRVKKGLGVTDEEWSAVTKHEKLAVGFINDHLDLRGTAIGGAQVSPKHGNIIVNTGTATAGDVVALISFIKQKVRDTIGVELQEEIQYVGF